MTTMLHTANFDGQDVDVTELIQFLDVIHEQRSDTHAPLRIVVPAAASQPELAITAIIHYARRWNGVRFLGMHYTRSYELENDDPVRFTSPYFSGPDRVMYFDRRPGHQPHLDVIDTSFGRVGRLYEKMHPHAIITQATVKTKVLGDVEYVSMGGSADYTHRFITETDIPLLVLHNANQPWLNGNLIPMGRITARTRFDSHVHGIPAASKDEHTTALFEQIAEYVINVMRKLKEERGEKLTVQMGVGVLPNFITGMAAGEDLIGRVWSEVIINAMMALDCELAGTLVLGDDELYEWVNDNPKVQLLSVEKTNNQGIVNALELVSIIQAMQVTLGGGTIVGKGKRHSGPGGAPDFGRSDEAERFIVMPSARYDREGNPLSSNIVLGANPLDHQVLLPMDRPNYVATEHGVANLLPHVREDGTVFTATAEEVALELIRVAHPAFREELWRQAFEAGIFAEGRMTPALADLAIAA